MPLMPVGDATTSEPEAALAAPSSLDPRHVGDIEGALGTVGHRETPAGRSRRARLRLLLVIIGPGLIVMGGGNDAGGVEVYTQMGQDYGMKLLWTLVLLFPILYVNQEMVVRLGAVSGVGHARLIFARFGRFWGAFSVIDLFIINAFTIVADFIGVSQSLSFFGLSTYLSVPLTAALLFVAIIGGSYRMWERFFVFLVILNFATFPMAFLVDSKVSTSAEGVLPTLPGGLDAGLLLLVVAVVGTTVEPWQLFFQQSSLVDKRITPRWIRYARIDLGLGVLVELVGALVLMMVAAFGLAHTPAAGNFTDLSDTTDALSAHVGHGVATLVALALLDGSLIGANLVGLTTTYTLGDVFGIRHSLRWKMREAKIFYGVYGVLLAVSAGVVLAAQDHLGLLIDGVEALNGVLLPSAIVFLLLLSNDRAVLGPWVNSTRQNVVSGVIIWVVVTFSLAPVVTTFFPDLSLAVILVTLAICAALGIAAAVLLWRRSMVRGGGAATSGATSGVDALTDPAGTVRPPGMSRAAWRTLLAQRRADWRTPALDTLEPAPMSTARRLGLLALRGYLIFAVVVLAIKLVDLAMHA
jgi:Mn2+/Fe2+ NRAMP family transporter